MVEHFVTQWSAAEYVNRKGFGAAVHQGYPHRLYKLVDVRVALKLLNLNSIRYMILADRICRYKKDFIK